MYRFLSPLIVLTGFKFNSVRAILLTVLRVV